MSGIQRRPGTDRVRIDWAEELREWPTLEWPPDPMRPESPTRRTVLSVRFLVLLGVVALGAFFIYLFDPDHRGDDWLFWPLAIGFIYRGLCWLLEWKYYARPRFERFRPPSRPWTVDVLTTFYPGEPRGMILRTLLAMKAIRYPHEDYLCDEGDDPLLKEACRQLGVHHMTRTSKKDAKAGNINNALAHSSGEIAVVLDPDHEPSPYLLDRTLGYFEDPKIGFVQTVQAYRNQKESAVALGAAKQTYLFYGPVMIGMNAYGTTQAIGANCVFRRAALDSIGGHAAGLSEDMHTTMRLYSKGWQSKYIPEVLTRGLAPSTLAAYCKQQLKWTCGTFELLFREYPKLFKGFTFWQRLHYFMVPLHYLQGVFGLVDIAVPIVCLFVGGVALRIDLISYLSIYAPLVITAVVLRQIAQRWVIEKSERGFHLIGGVLAMGCWWVFLRGLLCAVFRLKVPYIPTPKDNTPVDNWRLAMPNLIAASLSIAAVIYGLGIDWTPFSFLMAAFALSNGVQLLSVAMMGQQLTLQRIRHRLAQVQGWMGSTIVRSLIDTSRRIKYIALYLLREHGLIFSLSAVAAALIVHFWPKSDVPAEPGGEFKDTGGFYVGAALPEADRGAFPAGFEEASRQLNAPFRLFPFTQKWGPDSLANFPEDAMREARLHGAVPLITWEPWTSTFPELRSDPELGRDRGVCAAIARGVFDDYLKGYAEKIRNFGDPVLICFAPRADDPASPWSAAGGNTPEQFVQAWIHVLSIFDKMGASNAGWVWSPSSSTALDSRFAGPSYVDWISLPAFNKGNAAGGQWREFADLYEPYREKILEWKLPVMLTDFGSTDQGGSAARWIANACSAIVRNFPEIRGLVLSGEGTLTRATPEILSALREGLASAALHVAPPIPKPTALWRDQPRPVSRSTAITGSPGEFVLSVDSKPFYIRAVAYNPGHDWRDGNSPLTHRQLLSDFTSIQAMGANTIRRYGGGWYDRNIFIAAKDRNLRTNLRIIYGFWFGQDIDYITDSGKLAGYQKRVENAVLTWRNEPSLLAWSLGNEVWGLLKHHFAQPYLTEVRHAHIDFVEKLARRIHELDHTHPVFAANEHSSQLAGALADFARGAPSLDFVGVNSYYQPRIADLRRITSEFDPARPYLVSEFGPDGYWDAKMTPHDANGAMAEPLSSRKAYDYVRDWSVFVEPNRGANIGGVAYCWRDRLEATASWFGLTDWFGRKKPAYGALQRLWTGKTPAASPLIIALEAPSKPLRPGETIDVTAKVESAPDSTLHYHWELQTPDFEKNIGRVSIRGDGTSARVTLPNKPGLYRLYFSVDDGRTADIANVALTVTDRPAPESLGLEARAREAAPRPNP